LEVIVVSFFFAILLLLFTEIGEEGRRLCDFYGFVDDFHNHIVVVAIRTVFEHDSC
jgi:hypothetical protein